MKSKEKSSWVDFTILSALVDQISLPTLVLTRKAGFEGHFTSHSLRLICATRLYEGGMPEQVIEETTGHRSYDGVREHKFASSTFKRKASGILQGTIPKKVEIDAKEKEENLINNDV